MNSEQNQTQVESEASKKGRPAHHWWIALIAVAAVLVLLVQGILPRIQARESLRKETQDLAVASVAVVQPKISGAANEVVLPANVQAFVDSPIYARTNGY